MSEPNEAPAAPTTRADAFKRFASAGPIVPIIIWMLYGLPKWYFAVFVACTTTIIARELFAMVLPGEKAAGLWGTLSTLLVAAAFVAGDLHPAWQGAALTSAVALLLVGTLVASLARPDPVETAAARSGWLLGGPLYVGASMANLERLHLLPHGGGWVILAMMLAWFSDTAAYFAGRWFGKHKLYAKLSPKKTVEGALGGLFGSVIGGLCGHGAAGQAGDLFESLLKRSTGVKDSGTILPGHGGLLDRADALIYTAFFTLLYALYVLPHRG